MTPAEDQSSGQQTETTANTGPTATRLRSDDLFHDNRHLIIEHRGEDYCLRLTRNERLILTKL